LGCFEAFSRPLSSSRSLFFLKKFLQDVVCIPSGGYGILWQGLICRELSAGYAAIVDFN
jgi:hypothetical protein